MLKGLFVYLFCATLFQMTAAAGLPGAQNGNSQTTTTQAPVDAIQNVTSFEYKCEIGADEISFQRNQSNIPSSLEIKLLHLEKNDKNINESVYCINPNVTTLDSNITVFCPAKKKIVVIVQHKEPADKDAVFGGEHIKMFELSCNDSTAMSYTVKAQANINLPSSITAGTPKYDISGVSINTDKTEYAIGEKIVITLKRNNSNVYILPVSCIASDGSKKNLSIWDKTSCNKDHEELISKAWNKTQTGYKIQAYAFRFKASHTLLIQCEVKVCAAADSSQCQVPGNCYSKRRKRAAKSNSGDVTVSKRLYVKDLPYEVSVSGSDTHYKPLTYSVLLSVVISICISAIKY